jgi:hypothetical protein
MPRIESYIFQRIKDMDGKQIRAIKAEGLVYQTESGEEDFIDFSVCYANYIRKMTSPEGIERMKELNPQSQWDAEVVKRYIEKVTRRKEVGRRNVLSALWADGPYIEFHTEPPIRFDFATANDYAKVRHALEQFGWRTMDLS